MPKQFTGTLSERESAHAHIQNISFGGDDIISIIKRVALPVRPRQENTKCITAQYKQLPPCHTGVILVKGVRAKRLCHLPKPLQFEKKLRGKKEASLVDKSSFSSWLHTAAGGLTCHGRIQPLIHLCFPQVFLNFTRSSRATTKSEPALLCQPARRQHGLSSLGRILTITEAQSRLFFLLFFLLLLL